MSEFVMGATTMRHTLMLTTLVLSGVLMAACSSGPRVGTPAPALAGSDIQGRRISLDDYRGKVLLIDFWATWCPPCRQASPHIQALHEKYKGSPDVAILAVHAASNGTPEEYATEHGYSYPIIPDGAEIAETWNIRGLPTFVVLNRQGEVVYKKLGFYEGDEAALDKAIQSAL